jgi:hypothetical protein
MVLLKRDKAVSWREAATAAAESRTAEAETPNRLPTEHRVFVVQIGTSHLTRSDIRSYKRAAFHYRPGIDILRQIGRNMPGIKILHERIEPTGEFGIGSQLNADHLYLTACLL